jgi:hypothetical protein
MGLLGLDVGPGMYRCGMWGSSRWLGSLVRIRLGWVPWRGMLVLLPPGPGIGPFFLGISGLVGTTFINSKNILNKFVDSNGRLISNILLLEATIIK